MNKYIKFLVSTTDFFPGEMVDILSEDDYCLYYENDSGSPCFIEKGFENTYFEYVDEGTYNEYMSLWDDEDSWWDD
jgi:hypothetical protein